MFLAKEKKITIFIWNFFVFFELNISLQAKKEKGKYVKSTNILSNKYFLSSINLFINAKPDFKRASRF